MAAINQDDIVRVVCEWDIPDGTIAQLVYHYLMIDVGPIDSAIVLASVLAQLVTAWGNVAGDISDLFTGSTISLALYDFVLHRFDGLDVSPAIGVDGTDVSDPLPHGAAGLVKIFTVAARRQARKYIPGLVEVVCTAGTLLAPAVTNLALFAADLDTDIAPSARTFSFCTFNVDATSPLYETASVASQTVQAEAIVAYQRRRRPGTGI